ncbi:MAG: Cytochrome [Pedosphaera sp.]|nr:Cytochrome [Pedosphaera sp.]
MNNQPKTPGPSRLQLVRAYPRIRRDLTRYLADLATQYGDTVLLPLRYPTYMVRNPADIKHILVANFQNYHKAGGLKVGEELFGQGLVTSECPLHPKQRRIMQPMFHRGTIAKFGELMAVLTNDRACGWTDGALINLSTELMHLTLAIVGQSLFSVHVSQDGPGIGSAFVQCQTEITRIQRGFPLPSFFRIPANRRYQQGLKTVNDYILGLMQTRRTDPNPPDDLLSLLLASRYEDGTTMSDQQIRDEAVTLLMAGHETMTNSLSWALYLLSQHPQVMQKLQQELDTVLAGRLPAMADLPALRYTDMVLAESMRVFPPAWTLARRTLQEDVLPSGLTLPVNSEVLLCQFVCHRNPKYFPDPTRFDPERFDPAIKKEWPQFAYFPFGAGPRYCIGESFAKMEGVIVLATILQQLTLKLKPGQNIIPEPLITLRPKNGIWMKVTRR